jgi:hypothetical protein
MRIKRVELRRIGPKAFIDVEHRFDFPGIDRVIGVVDKKQRKTAVKATRSIATREFIKTSRETYAEFLLNLFPLLIRPAEYGR